MPKAWNYCLSVAGLVIQLETDRELEMQEPFLPFVSESLRSDFKATFCQVDQLPAIPEKVLHEDVCYRAHSCENGKVLRSFFDAPRERAPYAVADCDYSGGSIRIDYVESGAHCLSQMQNAFFHLGFEELLLYRGRLCFHAACVRTGLGGILFSGPSGVGKSTQAQLWCKHRGAEQINGDRPILSKEAGSWLAWGSPYAGSSRCYVNASCSVNAIVMLRQTESCSLRRLNPKEAFRAVWSGLTVSSWDPTAMETACDLALELGSSIPVYEFGCTPDLQAVEFLEQGLRKEGICDGTE